MSTIPGMSIPGPYQQAPTAWPPPAPVTHATKPRRRWPAATGAGVAGLVLGVMIGGAGGKDAAGTPVSAAKTSVVTVTRDGAPAAAAPSKASSKAAAPAAATIGGDGTYLVGTDIQPGTYRSGAPASGNCYWARMKDDGVSGIIANNNSSGPSIVTIKKTDALFKSDGCEDWTRVK